MGGWLSNGKGAAIWGIFLLLIRRGGWMIGYEDTVI